MVVRGHSAGLTAALRAAFATYVVDDQRSIANYSLRLSDDPTVFHALYQGSCLVVASPDAGRVVAALVRHIEAHAPTPAGLVPVQGIAIVTSGRATIVPTLIEDNLRDLARQLSADGSQVLDTHTVHLDLEAREVVVAPQLDLDRRALAEAVGLAPPPRRADLPVPDGRYPIDRWLLMELWDPPGLYSRATATRRAALVVRGGPLSAGPDTLERLAHLFEAVSAEGIDPRSRRETLELLRVEE